jgi:hypothetical protein
MPTSVISAIFFASRASFSFWNRVFFWLPTTKVASLVSEMVLSEPGCER